MNKLKSIGEAKCLQPFQKTDFNSYKN